MLAADMHLHAVASGVNQGNESNQVFDNLMRRSRKFLPVQPVMSGSMPVHETFPTKTDIAFDRTIAAIVDRIGAWPPVAVQGCGDLVTRIVNSVRIGAGEWRGTD